MEEVEIPFKRLIISYIDTLDFVTNSFLVSFTRINIDIAKEIIKTFMSNGKEVFMLISEDHVAKMIKDVIGIDIPLYKIILPPISDNDMIILFAFTDSSKDHKNALIYVCTSFKPFLKQFMKDTKKYFAILSRKREIPGIDV